MLHDVAGRPDRAKRRRTGIAWLLSTALAGSAFGTATPARAQSAGEETGARVHALTRDGLKKLAAGDYENARQAFQEAYNLSQETPVLLNLALAELNAGRPLDALLHFRQYMQRPDANPDKVAKVREQLIPQVSKQTAHINVKTLASASVELDGAPVASWNDGIDVIPGAHTLKIAVGHFTKTFNVAPAAGEQVSVTFEPRPATEAPPSIETQRQPTSMSQDTVAPTSEADTGASQWRNSIITGGAVLTLVGAGAATYFALRAKANDDEASETRASIIEPCATSVDYRDRCRSLQSSENRSDTFRTLENTMWIETAVVGVGTLAAFLFWPRRTAARGSTWYVAPHVGRTETTLTVGGSLQ